MSRTYRKARHFQTPSGDVPHIGRKGDEINQCDYLSDNAKNEAILHSDGTVTSSWGDTRGTRQDFHRASRRGAKLQIEVALEEMADTGIDHGGCQTIPCEECKFYDGMGDCIALNGCTCPDCETSRRDGQYDETYLLSLDLTPNTDDSWNRINSDYILADMEADELVESWKMYEDLWF